MASANSLNGLVEFYSCFGANQRVEERCLCQRILNKILLLFIVDLINIFIDGKDTLDVQALVTKNSA